MKLGLLQMRMELNRNSFVDLRNYECYESNPKTNNYSSGEVVPSHSNQAKSLITLHFFQLQLKKCRSQTLNQFS